MPSTAKDGTRLSLKGSGALLRLALTSALAESRKLKVVKCYSSFVCFDDSLMILFANACAL